MILKQDRLIVHLDEINRNGLKTVSDRKPFGPVWTFRASRPTRVNVLRKHDGGGTRRRRRLLASCRGRRTRSAVGDEWRRYGLPSSRLRRRTPSRGRRRARRSVGGNRWSRSGHVHVPWSARSARRSSTIAADTIQNNVVVASGFDRGQ